MSRRNERFSAQREPFRANPHINLSKDQKPKGPFSFANPTNAWFDFKPRGLHKTFSEHGHSQTSSPDYATGIRYGWTSRNNRKGRHTLIIDPTPGLHPEGLQLPPATNSARGVMLGIKRMFTQFPVWDVSYLVAQCFTWGSLVFVLNGLFYFLPVAFPSTFFGPNETVAGGVTGFIGTIFFQAGVIFLMLEVINENRTGCFGWALEKAVSGSGGQSHTSSSAGAHVTFVPNNDACVHHHTNKGNLVGKPDEPSRRSQAAINSANADGKQASSSTSNESSPNGSGGKDQGDEGSTAWKWWPSWHEFTTHYMHDMGFIANFTMFTAATIFWILGFTGLPHIFPTLTLAEQYGVFWAPDLIGSVGFVIASWLLMVETQTNWYTPAYDKLGWHVNVWNVIGSIGFLLSAIFGLASYTYPNLVYHSDLSTTWGSAAFLLASVLLWYEALDKHPVEYKVAPKSS